MPVNPPPLVSDGLAIPAARPLPPSGPPPKFNGCPLEPDRLSWTAPTATHLVGTATSAPKDRPPARGLAKRSACHPRQIRHLYRMIPVQDLARRRRSARTPASRRSTPIQHQEIRQFPENSSARPDPRPLRNRPAQVEFPSPMWRLHRPLSRSAHSGQRSRPIDAGQAWCLRTRSNQYQPGRDPRPSPRHWYAEYRDRPRDEVGTATRSQRRIQLTR